MEYRIPPAIGAKMHFTGYIPRKVPDRKGVKQVRREQGVDNGEKLVVVTTGGGGDGYPVMSTFLDVLERRAAHGQPLGFKSVLITGPFMPKQERRRLFKRARKLGVRTYHFYRQMEKILSAADLVVCMGGYNTICEILSQKTVSLVIPRETPRKEQLIRAQALHSQRLIDYLPWSQLEPGPLETKLEKMLASPDPYRQAISRFELTGIDAMVKRICLHRGC